MENPEEVLDQLENRIQKREGRLLEALKTGPKIFTELLPEMFRHEFQYRFPGAAILTSHLIKLEAEGEVVQEEGRYFFAS